MSELERVSIRDDDEDAMRDDQTYLVLEDGRVRVLHLRVARGFIRDQPPKRTVSNLFHQALDRLGIEVREYSPDPRPQLRMEGWVHEYLAAEPVLVDGKPSPRSSVFYEHTEDMDRLPKLREGLLRATLTIQLEEG